MGRKLSNDVDGFAVDEYAGTFSGTFDVADSDVRHMAYDDEVLLVVRARVKVPRLKETLKGEIIRINVLGVKEVAVVRSDTLKKHLCDSLGLEVPAPQLTLDLTPGSTTYEEPGITPAVLEEPAEILETSVEVFSPGDMSGDPDAGLKVQKFDPDEPFDSPKKDLLASFLAEGAEV